MGFQIIPICEIACEHMQRILDCQGESQQVPHVVCNVAATLPHLAQAHIKRET